jgi:hypothetical protein
MCLESVKNESSHPITIQFAVSLSRNFRFKILFTFEFCKFVELVKLRDKHFMEIVAVKAAVEKEARKWMKSWSESLMKAYLWVWLKFGSSFLRKLVKIFASNWPSCQSK